MCDVYVKACGIEIHSYYVIVENRNLWVFVLDLLATNENYCHMARYSSRHTHFCIHNSMFLFVWVYACVWIAIAANVVVGCYWYWHRHPPARHNSYPRRKLFEWSVVIYFRRKMIKLNRWNKIVFVVVNFYITWGFHFLSLQWYNNFNIGMVIRLSNCCLFFHQGCTSFTHTLHNF